MYICLYYINWVASSASSAPFVLINPPSLLRCGHPQEEYEHKFKSGIEIYILLHSQADYPVPNFMTGDQPPS